MSSNRFVITVTRAKCEHSETNHDMMYTRCSTSSVVKMVTFWNIQSLGYWHTINEAICTSWRSIYFQVYMTRKLVNMGQNIYIRKPKLDRHIFITCGH